MQPASNQGEADKKDRSGNSSLHLASQKGQTDAVRALVAIGAFVNLRNFEGETPLHLAAQGGHKAVVQILLDAGADPTMQDNNGATPCHLAASEGFLEIMELMSKKECDYTNKVRLYYEPVPTDHPYEMHLARMTIKDNDTPHKEAGNSDRVLTEKPTSPKEDNIMGSNVKKTKRGGRKHKKKQNEQENIPVQKIRPDKITDLYLRIMTLYPDDLEEKLRDYFFDGRFDEINCAVIDTNRTDRAGLTILHHAVRCCRYMAVERLVVKCKANVNAQSFRGVTPMFLAAVTGYSDVIRILHENGADINHTLKCGMTPLHYAVIHKNVNSVLTLTFLGANINSPDKNGNTPLHYGAMTTRNLKVVETLVEKGADVQFINCEGLRPLEVAKKGCDKEIPQFLASVTPDIKATN